MFAEECDPNQVYRAACPSSRSLNIEYDETRAGSTCHRLDQQWPTGATPAESRRGMADMRELTRHVRYAPTLNVKLPRAYSMWHQT